MNEIAHELQRRIQGEVRFDKYARVLYSSDASIYEIEPLGVVIPKTPEDLQATVEVAHRHEVPLVPRGGGTSIVGNSIGPGVVVDCSKYLHRILEVNTEERWARVQPGVVLDQLNAHLKPLKLLFGPDVATSSRANLGGMIGNNSSGAHSILYGKTLDHVHELKVLLANGEEVQLGPLTPEEWASRVRGDGLLNAIYRRVQEVVEKNRDEIDKRFPKILRRVAGYNLDEFVRQNHHNLAKLVVGSEGTLGVVTEAKVNLVPRPEHSVLAVVHFADLFEALEAVSPILQFGPAAVELLDHNILDLTRGTMEYARRLTFVEGYPAALLLVEFQGDSKAELEERLNKLAEFLAKEKLGYFCYKASEEAQQADVWYVRKAGLGLLLSTRADRKPVGFVEDSAVPPERLPEYIRRFDEIVRSHGTDAAYYAHASVGCLHIRPKLNLKESKDVEAMASIADGVSSLALEFGGTISGEHGDGLAHSCWNEKMFGPQLYRAFAEVKQAFDPKNIFNPGKIVDAQFLTENFRSYPKPEHRPITPFLDYSKEGGFEKAVEMCNGNGMCRKKDGGTMCPSFMVTLEEEHSTRGRANALRGVLTGRLEPEAFTSRRMYEVLDLCIGCKGCKGECPTNVDMAKLKYEFLYHYNQRHGVPLRDRLFANIAALNRLGCALAPLSNWATRLPLAHWLMHRLLGIDCRRALPKFARPRFDRWFKRHRNGTNSQEATGKVVLFHDTFMTYNAPEIGRAAVVVLEAAGCEVVLAERKCCGRPFISKGMLEEARAHAQFNVEKLVPWVERGYAVVGCEPSCLLTFREEYPDLLDDPRVQTLAEHAFLIEEFLQKLADEDGVRLPLRPARSDVLLHGHCHLKALVGLQPTLRMLQMIPGAAVEVVDSGCCGMAGSFGFEREHYEVSMAMGRRKLFGAVESKSDGWAIVAPGVSCRQQIEHGTGRRARHPVEVLAGQLAVEG